MQRRGIIMICGLRGIFMDDLGDMFNNAGSVYSVEEITPGVSFRIVSNNDIDASAINWFIVN
jgi:hypothetical protein